MPSHLETNGIGVCVDDCASLPNFVSTELYDPEGFASFVVLFEL